MQCIYAPADLIQIHPCRAARAAEGEMGKGPNGKEAERREGALRGLVLALTMIGLEPCAGAQANPSAAQQANLRITLRVYNYGISRALLARAEGEATAILNQAGLELAWIDCPLTAAERESYPACQAPAGTADFAVKILTARGTERFYSHHEALGQALECPRNEIGCAAYIFYRDVLELAREGDAAEYQLLGHALAHEIGHLLLGPNSHAATGIMRARWSHQELQTMARAYLLFTDQQSERIRKEVSARNAIRHDRMASAATP